MINKDNYFEKIKTFDPASLPAGLKKGYEFVKDATENHRTWQFYKSGDTVRQRIDMYFEALAEYLKRSQKQDEASSEKHDKREAENFAITMITRLIHRGETVKTLAEGAPRDLHDHKSSFRIERYKTFVTQLHGKEVLHFFPLQHIYNMAKDEAEKIKPSASAEDNTATQPSAKKPKPETKPSKPSAAKKAKPDKVEEVERIEDEITFIKRYANMQGKEKTDLQLLGLLNPLQKAIQEKRIRKTSRFKKEINYIQENLVALINRLRKIPEPEERIAEIKINPNVLEHFQKLGGSEKVRLSVAYIKRYIGIQGKSINKEKAQRLLAILDTAMAKGKIAQGDTNRYQLKTIYKSLEKFAKTADKKDSLELHEAVLNGINDALGCGCDEKKKGELSSASSDLSITQKDTVMNSLDFTKLKFDTMGFTGKWLALIGDPSPGFRAMVFGKPKYGKSHLCVDWAGYLARHHGDTLYFASEESLGATLQKKLIEKEVGHRSLDVSACLPKDLSKYQNIFIDSVTKEKLTPEKMDELVAANPGKNFIEVHQVNKAGRSRGSNEHLHNADIVIEVPERGRAVQFGRFNQGGEMQIFEQEEGLHQEAA